MVVVVVVEMNALAAGTEDVVDIVSAGAKPCATFFRCRTPRNDKVVMKMTIAVNDVDGIMAFVVQLALVEN